MWWTDVSFSLIPLPILTSKTAESFWFIDLTSSVPIFEIWGRQLLVSWLASKSSILNTLYTVIDRKFSTFMKRRPSSCSSQDGTSPPKTYPFLNILAECLCPRLRIFHFQRPPVKFMQTFPAPPSNNKLNSILIHEENSFTVSLSLISPERLGRKQLALHSPCIFHLSKVHQPSISVLLLLQLSFYIQPTFRNRAYSYTHFGVLIYACSIFTLYSYNVDEFCTKNCNTYC